MYYVILFMVLNARRASLRSLVAAENEMQPMCIAAECFSSKIMMFSGQPARAQL